MSERLYDCEYVCRIITYPDGEVISEHTFNSKDGAFKFKSKIKSDKIQRTHYVIVELRYYEGYYDSEVLIEEGEING